MTGIGRGSDKGGAPLRKASLVFELTDGEIRAFWFSVHPFRHQGHGSNTAKFDRIPIPTGIIEHGNVRDQNTLIGILLDYKAQTSRQCQKVYLAIPLQQGFIRSYTLPWIPKRNRKSAMSLLVDEEIPIAFARSDLLYDFLVISEERHTRLQVLLGATRQSLLERYIYVFRQAGFKVTGVDFSFSVLGQALGFKPNEDILYLQGEPDAFHMALFRGAVPEIVRTLPALPTIAESVEGILERTEAWGNEIRRFLLYYRTQKTDLNLKRLVWNGDSVANQLAHELLESNHVSSVEQAELQGIPRAWQEMLEKGNVRGEVVAGYGLRMSARRPVLNLWRESNEMEIGLRRYQGIALFAVALLVVGTMTWVSLYQRTISLKSEVQRLSNQGARIVAQVKHQKELQAAWEKEKIDQGNIVDLIQVQAIPSTELTIEHVSYKQGNLSLSGRANDAKSVQTMLRAVRTMGWEQPGLSSYKLTSRNNVEFSLSGKRGVVGTQDTTETTSTTFTERG